VRIQSGFICVCIGLVFSAWPPAFAEDLLAEDDFSFEPLAQETTTRHWRDALRFTLQHSLSQGDRLQLARSEARMAFEQAPWQNAYVKLDQRAYYFAHKDRQARQQGTDYGHYQLKELWLQQTQDACFVKLGRQNIIWGSVEGTFSVDLISPFDFTEPLFTEFSSIRRSQDLLLSTCFWGAHQIQAFVIPRARLDQVQHRQTGEWKTLESSLNEEWGLRYLHQREGFDVHLMAARLHANTPVLVLEPISAPIPALAPNLKAPRFNLFGVTAVKAIDRLLLEIDLAYKTDQLEAFSGRSEDQWELSTGFEYTTASNHAFNAGVWWYQAQAQSLNTRFKRARAWTAGWNNSYWNDDLTLRFLGTYLSKPRQHTGTFQAEYQWDDYYTYAAALAYSDYDEPVTGVEEGWQITAQIKWEI